MDLRRSNMADVAAQAVSAIVGRGCYLALQVFLARSLGPHEFGLYAIGWTVTGLIGTFAPVGMPQTVLRYGVAGRRALRTAPIAIAAIAGMFCFAVLMAIASPLANLLFAEPTAAPVILALAPSVPLLCIFAVLASALRSSQANLASAAVGALQFVLYFGLTVVGFSAGVPHTPVMAGHVYTVAIMLTLFPTGWMLYQLAPSSTIPEVQNLLKFGLVTMMIHSASVMNLWADRVVIGVMADAQAVGLYQVASQLAMLALVLRVAVISVFEARVPKLAHSGAPLPDVSREFLSASRILLHVSTPGLICLALTAKFWTAALFGADYIPAAVPLAILALGQLIQTFTGPSLTALHMTGGERTALHLTIGTCLLNVIGNVALIPLWGLAGSAVASSVANIALVGASLFLLLRTGRLRLYFTGIGDILWATLFSAVAAALISYSFGVDSTFSIVTTLIVAYAAYGIVVALCCRVEDEVLDLGRALLRRRMHLQQDTRV